MTLKLTKPVLRLLEILHIIQPRVDNPIRSLVSSTQFISCHFSVKSFLSIIGNLFFLIPDCEFQIKLMASQTLNEACCKSYARSVESRF